MLHDYSIRMSRDAVTVLAYADDTTLVAPTHARLAEGAQRLEESLNTVGLEINATKSQVISVSFASGAAKRAGGDIMLKGGSVVPTPARAEVRLLGLLIAGNGSYNPQRAHARQELSTRFRSLYAFHGTTRQLIRAAISSLVLSSVTHLHGTPWWTPRYLRELDESHSRRLRKALHAHWDDSITTPDVLYSRKVGFGMPSIRHSLLKGHLAHLLRMANSP